MQWIPRAGLLSSIQGLLEDFPAVGILGARQVGKTTAVKSLLEIDELVYLDLESDVDQAKLTDPGLFLRNNADKCIVLDEVQYRQDLFPLLRAIIDEDRRPGRFILLGSASPVLLRKSADSLAGRIAYHRMNPLGLPEVGYDKLNQLWIRGGFPNAFKSRSDSASHTWRQQFIKSYIERDLPSLGLDTNTRTLTNFLRMLSASVGQIWNASMFSKSLGITAPTVKRYLDFLEQAFLIRVLEPYHVNVKKRLVKSPKVYYADTGILHTLQQIVDFDALSGLPILGNSWENYVIGEILKVLPDDYEPYFYRTHEGAEIDLLLVKNQQPAIGIEIKYSNAPKLTKGFLNAIADVGTTSNFIITPGSDRFAVHEQIEVISLAGFLQSDIL